ncbi:Sfi1 spindle body [Penicillium verhagenii]|uniref:Sfi1 spindle body n=1 Tax=Penicillium verhagenii TaxID=1562060 RepID=UPI0025450FC5|nr:Sfi1 spindle body [Penicillium verhagenii]KAJ5917375.1 Sfi1 spindle body [Penicillium verhagenii]
MPPISSQRRDFTEEKQSLSDDDVGFLYQVITRAEGKPEAAKTPFRALFAAYDEAVSEHGVDPDPGHACLGFLFKMGSKNIEGLTLFDKFENTLQHMGIVIEMGDEGSTGFNDTVADSHYLDDGIHSHNGHQHHPNPITNGTPITPRRRASFNTTMDIGEDATQRSFIERPSSRSSMSRLQTGKPDFAKHKLSPKLNASNSTPQSPDRTQLIAQFLDVGRRLISRFDSVQNKKVDPEEAPLTNGVLARAAVDRERSQRMVASSQSRHTPSVTSSDSAESEDSYSSVPEAEHDSVDKQPPPPENIYQPQISDMLRDADTFNMYRQRAIHRTIFRQWFKRAFQASQTREKRESIAINRDRGTLLRQAFEPWLAIIQQKRHAARTDRFFKHLDERANRARNLYLMTKAFTHWAQFTSEEVARTSAARRHVLSIKYFNAWREITAVNELKAQRFALQRPFNKWRKKLLNVKQAEGQAVTMHQKSLQHASYWQWFWGFCERRAPEWYDYRLKRRSLLYWLQNFRTNRERDHEIAVHNRRCALGSALQVWSQRVRAIGSAQQLAEKTQRHLALTEAFGEWKIQSRLAPAASRITDMVDTRVLRNALSKWISRARMMERAQELDQQRIQRNAWTSWNDTLRCLALRARIDERLKMEIMYKWIVMERFQLMRRIHEQRIKREVFTRFVTNTRDTYTRLLFNAEAHEENRTEDLARSKLALWRERLVIQREREYTAFEFYAPRLAQESLMAWRSKHEQNKKMEGWANDARFYFLMKRTLQDWRQATLDSAKRRRKEAYAKVRRKIKMNLASNALATWRSKTHAIMDMDQQAEDVDRGKVLEDSFECFSRWHGKALKRVQDYQDADYHYLRQVAFDQLIQMSETFVIRREMEDEADNFHRAHILQQAGGALRKLSLRIFQMRNTVETSEAMRERTLRKHSRNYFRHWLEEARLKFEARDSPGPSLGPSLTPGRFSNAPHVNGNGALFDPWYRNPAETPFKLADITATSQEHVSASPLATPNYLTSPSKRAARARALAQMSNTPATPLHTPFASRLLRAESSTGRSASSLRPRTGRGNSIATSVRFADDDLPESPTDGRKSASRRP